MSQVIKQFEERNISFQFVCSGQHTKTIFPLLNYFKLPRPEFLSLESPNSLAKALVWQAKCLPKMLKLYKFVIKRKSAVIVHGDCFTVLMGSIFAKTVNAKLIHVESGYRTSSFFEPFPEMFVRVIADKISDILFTQSNVEHDNLLREGNKGRIINIGANTVLDSLRFAISNPINRAEHSDPYAVCTIHRFETLHSQKRIRIVRDLLKMVSEQIRVVFVAHGYTKKFLNLEGMNIEVKPFLPYSEFIEKVWNSEFVVTDSGGLQAECFYMGKPCLLFRKETGIIQGLGENTILSEFRESKVKDFLLNYKNFKVKNPMINQNDIQPSRVIVDVLEKID